MSAFCHFCLVLFLVLWRSPDTPVMSCFHMSSLVCMPGFLLERGVWIPAIMSWVSVSCQGSDTRAPCSVLLCERAVPSLLSHALSCPCVLCFVLLQAVCVFISCVHSRYVLCCVAHSLCIHWLRAFMLSCLVWTCGLWVFSLAACSCPVLHMSGELFCWPCVRVFVLCEHIVFVLVFCVPCALMLILLTQTILFPDCWLICSTWLSSLPSSFAPFIISLCLQSWASSLSYVPLLCADSALPCQACQLSCFPLRGSFCLFLL